MVRAIPSSDELPRDEIPGRHMVAASVEGSVDAPPPLATNLAADVVTIQITSTDQPAPISLLGREVLPPSPKVRSAHLVGSSAPFHQRER